MAQSDEMPDGDVHMTSESLASIQIHHVFSALRPIAPSQGGTNAGSGAYVRTGYTEWASGYSSRPVRVAWEWGIVCKVMIFLEPFQIRSNIRLTGDDGALLPSNLEKIHLFEWVESFDWRTQTRRYLSDNLLEKS